MIAQKTTFCGTILVLLLSIVITHGGLLFSVDKDLIFRLYTPEQPDLYEEMKVDNLPPISLTSFNSSRPTRIFIHGFRSGENMMFRYRDAYLKAGNFNFIAVDWTKGAQTYNYLMVKNRVRPISEKLAILLATLAFKRGVNLRDVTIVGHSLGAHIAGRAGKLVQTVRPYIGKVGCIFGLDPASFGFSYDNPEKRLAKTDADYVQVIHTDGSKFGISYPIGHADFYPNLGKDQPGCAERNMITTWIDKCSHIRANHLFLESLAVNFTAIHCDSLTEIQNGLCAFDNVTAPLGGDITAETTPKPYGIFYLETRSEPPYFIPDYKSFNKTVIIDMCPNVEK